MKNLKKKTILALAVMLLLASAGTFFLVREGGRLVEERTETRSIRKLEAADNLYGLILERVGSAHDSLMNNGRITVEIMTAALREYLTDGAYTGPVCFGDGLVFRMEDGRPVFPDTVPESFVGFEAKAVERALGDSCHYGGMVQKAGDLSKEELAELEHQDPFEYMGHYFLAFIDEIGDGWYYAALSEAAEFYRSLETFTYAEELIAATEEAFGGALLILETTDSRLPLNFLSSRFGEVDYAADLGLTMEDVQNREKLLTIDGKPWRCSYRSSEAADEIVLVFASPYESDRTELSMELLPVMLLMVLFFATLSIYVVSAQAFVRDRVLGENLASKYRPVNLRIRCVALGAVGAALVFCAAGLLQAVSVLRSETLAGSEAVQALFENLQELEAEKNEAARENQEAWYAGYAERIAGLIAEDPALAKGERLQEFCTILQADYLMTFDPRGRESACSCGYRDFTLNTGEGDCWDDFGRLLMGIPAIVRNTETDARTGLTRQLIGTCLPGEGSGRYGALVMALFPDTIGAREKRYGTFEQLKSLTTEGTTTLFTDAESGTILYASDPAVVGNEITEYGLSAESLRDGYMDFALIGGVQSYVVTTKTGDTVIYSITDTSVLFRHCLSYGLMAALVFFAIFITLYGVLMFGYTEHELAVYSRIGMPLEDDAARAYFGRRTTGKAPDRTGRRRIDLSSWRATKPEGKAAACFRSLSCVVVLLYLLVRAGRSGVRFSLLRYIMQGDWMRGINLFSLCATVVLIIGVYVFLTLCRGAVRLLCCALDSRGETICRLLFNLAQYIAIFVLLYQAFSYMGFPTGTVLASVGIATLAITFGAQNLVADVLAGVFNVLEGGYRVGDFIRIDGFEGTVRSIGVRTTRVESRTQDIEIIENSKIGKVINMTPLDSIVELMLVVPCSESLERIEAIFREEFPKIGSRMAEIVSGPTYMGVCEICSSNVVPHEPSMTLLVHVSTKIENYKAVQWYVNRELMLLCQRENIRIL